MRTAPCATNNSVAFDRRSEDVDLFRRKVGHTVQYINHADTTSV